jgi:hypothetical protein
VFTRARHWSLPWARWIHSTPFHPVTLHIRLVWIFRSLWKWQVHYANTSMWGIAHCLKCIFDRHDVSEVAATHLQMIFMSLYGFILNIRGTWTAGRPSATETRQHNEVAIYSTRLTLLAVGWNGRATGNVKDQAYRLFAELNVKKQVLICLVTHPTVYSSSCDNRITNDRRIHSAEGSRQTGGYFGHCKTHKLELNRDSLLYLICWVIFRNFRGIKSHSIS